MRVYKLVELFFSITAHVIELNFLELIEVKINSVGLKYEERVDSFRDLIELSIT